MIPGAVATAAAVAEIEVAIRSALPAGLTTDASEEARAFCVVARAQALRVA